MADPYFDEYGQPIIPTFGAAGPQIQAGDQTPLDSAAEPGVSEGQRESVQSRAAIGREAPPPPTYAYQQTKPEAPLASVTGPVLVPDTAPHDVPSKLSPAAADAVKFDQANPTSGQLADPFAAPKATPGLEDVAGWDAEHTKALENQGKAEEAAGLARLAADQAQTDRSVGALQEHTKQMGVLNESYTRAKLANEAATDQEQATWLRQQQILAEKEPNRARYWESQSGFGKAIWLLSVGANAFANSNHPGAPNMALNMLMDEVNQDTAAQKDRLGRQVELGKTKGQLLKDKETRRVHDTEDEYSQRFQRLEAVKAELLERAKRKGSPEELAIKAGVLQNITLRQTEEVSKRGERALAARNTRLAQEHATKLQGMQQAFTHGENQAKFRQESAESVLDRKNQRDLAQMRIDGELKAAQEKDKAKGEATQMPINEKTGIRMRVTDPVTGKVSFSQPTVTEKNHDNYDKYVSLGIEGNTQQKDYQDLLALAKKQSVTDMARGGTLEYKELLEKVSRNLAKAQNGNRVTNDDLTSSKLQFGSQTFLQKVITPGDTKEAIVKNLEDKLRNLRSVVNNELSRIPAEAGQELYWEPQRVDVDKAVPLTMDAQLAKAGANPPTPDFDDREAPSKDQPAIQAALDNFQHASFENVDKFEVAATRDSHGRPIVSPEAQRDIHKAAEEQRKIAKDAQESAIRDLADAFLDKEPARDDIKKALISKGITPGTEDIIKALDDYQKYIKHPDTGTARKAYNLVTGD